jgi:hypothetical protein
MNQVKHTLIQRLEKKGLDSNLIPSFIRSIANSYVVNPQMSVSQVNQKLHYLGWAGVEMDYHTFQLVLACFEDEGLKRMENKSIRWFTKRFDPKRLSADDLPDPVTEIVF